MENFNKVILAHIKLMRFAFLPSFLGGIACFIGPPHSPLLKTAFGVVIGLAIQHRYMVQAIKEVIKATDEMFDN